LESQYYGDSQPIAPLLSVLEDASRQHRRKAQEGDFDRFNELFQGASINIPDDFEVSERVALIMLTLYVNNIRCYQISVGNIALDHAKTNTDIDVTVNISELDMICDIDYRYEYGLLKGGGVAQVFTDNNSAATTLRFTSDDYQFKPPSTSSVQQCVTDIEIVNIDFHEDFASDIVELFERWIRDLVEKDIEAVACSELGTLGTSFVEDMLQVADKTLQGYQNENVDQDVNNPLYLEAGTELSGELVPLNFQETDTVIGDWFNQALQQVDDLLGTVMPDPEGPSDSDLGINILLRSNVLDESRALVVDVDELGMDAVLFEGHDKLTQSKLTLNQVKVFGLDTLTHFDPLNAVGKHTLHNQLTWDHLSLQFDVTVDIKPSSLEGAVLQDATSNGIAERIKIDFGVKTVNVEPSLYLVIDQEALGMMELGRILKMDNLLPCLMSVIHDVRLSGLRVDPQLIDIPSLTGFVSPGLDRVISGAVVAAFDMYNGALANAIPNIFQTTVRNFINNQIIFPYTNGDSPCPRISDVEGFVDFRDLLLPPDLALQQGGTGMMPYGDLAYTAMDLVKENLLSADSSGFLDLNSAMIRPATEKQSGTSGMLRFANDLISLSRTEFANDYISSFVDTFEIGLSDLRIYNLDILKEPVAFLETTKDPYTLSNTLTMGPISNRPINVTVGFFLALSGTDSPLQMENEIDISLSLNSAAVKGSLIAQIWASRLLRFPLKDVLEPYCWLATILAPGAVNVFDGETSSTASTLSMSDFNMTLSTLNFDANYLRSTSSGVAAIGDLLDIFSSSNASSVLQQRLSAYGKDFIDSGWFQSHIDQLLVDAPKFCPHSSEYDENSKLSRLEMTVPPMSPTTMDSFLFMSSLVAEVGVIVFMESHRLDGAVKPTHALSSQNAMSDTESERFVDFTNLESDLHSEIGKFVNKALEEMKDYLNTRTDSGELGINVLMKDWLLNNEGTLAFDFEDLSLELADVAIVFSSISIRGLDTFRSLEVADAISPQTLDNRFEIEMLDFELELEVLNIETKSRQNGLKVSFTLRDIEVSVPLFLALDIQQIATLQLGSILRTENILPCVLSIVDSIEIPQLAIRILDVGQPKVEGLQPVTDSAFYAFTNQVFEAYKTKMLEAAPLVFDQTIRPILNGLVRTFVEGDPCPIYDSSDDLGFVDLRQFFEPSSSGTSHSPSMLRKIFDTNEYGNFPSMLKGLLETELLAVDAMTGRPKINEVLIQPFTLRQSGTEGTLAFDGDLFETGTRVSVGGLDANIQLKASDAKIENLDTVTLPLALLEPVVNEPHYLNNTATIGFEERPLRLSTKFLFAIAGDDDTEIKNELDISLDLDTANVVLAAMLKIAKSRLLGFPLRDIFDFNCWAAIIPAPLLDSRGIRLKDSEITATMAEIAASISRLNLNISCVECSSPGMMEFTELLSTKEAQNDATDVVNSLLDSITQLIEGNFMQVKIDRFLAEAARKCPHSPEYLSSPSTIEYEPFNMPQNESDITYLMLLGAVTLGLIASIAILIFWIKCLVRRRHRRWLAKLPKGQLANLERLQKKEESIEAKLNATTTSMFKSAEVPRVVQWGMPVVILGNIGLFLSGHLSLGATVNIEAQIAGETIRVEQFFEFSMAKSTMDIWNAGGKELAILILIFSGIWPYTKQLITLVVWFTPPSWVSISRRGSILLWLDWLAKWSMIDIFVLVISIAAFRVSIQSPGVLFLPDDFYSIDLLVVPLWGLYANMIAQLVSQISSHFIIHYHRSIVNTAEESFKQHNSMSQSTSGSLAADDSQNMEVLKNHHFGRPHRCEFEKLNVRGWVNYALVGVTSCMGLFAILGCTLPSFSLNILGLIGVAVESGQQFEEATTYHSVFTVINLLMEEARFLDTAADYIGLGSLSLLFLLTVLIVPVLQSAALLWQWFSPMTTTKRLQVSLVTEVLQAWQYAEVYLIAIFVASWQLGPVSEFMINSYCESLDGFFAQMVYFGLLKEEDAQCFSVQSSIEEGFFILAVAATLLALINTFVTKAVTQYFRDKSELEKQIEDEVSTSHEEKLQEELELNTSLAKEHSEEHQEMVQNDGTLDPATRIHPVPVLFTDTFRWLLQRNDGLSGSSRAFEAQFDLPTATFGGSSEESAEVENSIEEQYPSVKGSDAAIENEGLAHDPNNEETGFQMADEECGISRISSLDDDSFVVDPVPTGSCCTSIVDINGPEQVKRKSASLNNRPDEGDGNIIELARTPIQ